ncbi:hypothetical protein OHB12_16370 [Nocardia sp. NBC_01730]|uniref:hypothetical protein n=1 Tax=Nocardia sp. NBC_01730 TaxID=2975998 RepID=UPI002E0F9C76|nr:hypothetical protein OHB12_16370 [Nocardia sp. NBC_01730]
MHLSVSLHGVRFDYIACVTAAIVFVQEWRYKHFEDAVEILLGGASGLPRLPNERLYLDL